MVLRPQQSKTALSTSTTTAAAASFSWVVSLPTHEPLVLNDANRYEAWHSAMCEEIQALRANRTWTLLQQQHDSIIFPEIRTSTEFVFYDL
jgi:hypothetical protein